MAKMELNDIVVSKAIVKSFSKDILDFVIYLMKPMSVK
jgi:hypothetical protein